RRSVIETRHALAFLIDDVPVRPQTTFLRSSKCVVTVLGRNRPSLRWGGPCKASQVARRAASSRYSSSLSRSSREEAESLVVTKPMIPVIHEGLVVAVKQSKPTSKSPPDVRFWDGVAARSDSAPNAFHRVVSGG